MMMNGSSADSYELGLMRNNSFPSPPDSAVTPDKFGFPKHQIPVVKVSRDSKDGGIPPVTLSESHLRRQYLRSRSLSQGHVIERVSSAGSARSRPSDLATERTALLSPPPPPPSPLQTNNSDMLSLALLPLPVITYDAASAPSSPTESHRSGPWHYGGAFRGNKYEPRTVLVTQRGSFLAVGQTPQELRDSYMSISSTYPDCLHLIAGKQ